MYNITEPLSLLPYHTLRPVSNLSLFRFSFRPARVCSSEFSFRRDSTAFCCKQFIQYLAKIQFGSRCAVSHLGGCCSIFIVNPWVDCISTTLSTLTAVDQVQHLLSVLVRHRTSGFKHCLTFCKPSIIFLVVCDLQKGENNSSRRAAIGSCPHGLE